VLRDDGRLIPTTQFALTRKTVHPLEEDAAEQAREYVRRRWKYCEPLVPENGLDCEPGGGCRTGPLMDLFDRARSHFLCISGMAFQDAWNVDLKRLQRCCVHVLTEEKQLIPFCAYYMTSANGCRLMDIRNTGGNSLTTAL
jgi:hypothetical protein